MKKLYDIPEVAEILKVHENTVRNEINRGNLATFRAGREYRIPQDELDRYMKVSRKSKPEKKESNN